MVGSYKKLVITNIHLFLGDPELFKDILKTNSISKSTEHTSECQ